MSTNNYAWSSSEDDDEELETLGAGVVLRKKLLRFASVDASSFPGLGGDVTKALELAASGDDTGTSVVIGKRGGAMAGAATTAADRAGEILLAGLSDDELLRMREDAIYQVKGELLVPSELEAKTHALLVSCTRDRGEIVRSMNAIVTQQARDADRAITILRASEDAIEHLKEGFQSINTMIGSMQSVEAYERLRQLHFYRQNSLAIVQWCTVFVNMSQPKEYEDAITGGGPEALPDVYEDLITMQKIRSALAAVGARFRGQMVTMRRTFDVADELIAMLVKRVAEILMTSVELAFNGGNNDDDEDEDGEGGGGKTDSATQREFLLAALKIVDKENGHEGGLLRLRGGTESTPYDMSSADAESPLCTGAVEEILADGADEFFLDKLMVDSNGTFIDTIGGLGNAIDSAVDLLPMIEDTMLPIRTNVKLTQNLIAGLHDSVMRKIKHFIKLSEDGEGVTAQDMLALMRRLENYRESSIDYGGIVSNYTDVEDVDETQRRLLNAAVEGLQDFMVQLCEGSSLQSAQDTIKKAQMPDPSKPNAALDVMAVIDSNVRAVASGAQLTVLHKLAVATALALQAFVEDQLRRLSWNNFHDAVKEYYAEWAKHNAAPDGAPAAAAAPEKKKKKKGWFGGGGKEVEEAPKKELIVEGTKPLMPDDPQTNDVWLFLQVTTLNGLTDMKKKVPNIDRYFGAMYDADEVDLTMAGALASDHRPNEDEPVRWESPIMVVLRDFDPVLDEFLNRILQYLTDVEMHDAWEAMFNSPEWKTHPPLKPPLTDIITAAKNYTDIAEGLWDEWPVEFLCRLPGHLGVVYLENLARFLKVTGKWTFTKNMDYDISTLSYHLEDVYKEKLGADEKNPDTKKCLDAVRAAIAQLRTALRFMEMVTGGDVEKFSKFVQSDFMPAFGDATEFLPSLLITSRGDVDRKTRDKLDAEFRSLWARRSGGPPRSIVARVDEGVVTRPRPSKGGWFSRAQPGETGVTQRQSTATTSVIQMDANAAPTSKRKKARKALEAPSKKKAMTADEPKVMSMAELLAAANNKQ
jgi:hypothetical protein